MRILLLAHGPSIHTRRWVAALEGRGHDVLLVTAHAVRDAGVATRVVGSPWPIRALRYLSALQPLRREIRAFLPDVTVAHFLPNYGWLAALSGTRPWMLACWGSDLLVNARKTPLHLARARYILREADAIHVDAAVLAEAAVALGAPPDRIWTRAWGVDEEALRPPGIRGARADDGATRVLWTRQLEPIYDPDTFVRALAILKRRGVRFRAAMAGDGLLRRSVAERIREEGVEAEVSLEGFVPAGRLRELYRASDVYVSLSRSDSTSQSLLEAMAAGLFPIVSDIAGNREWITHRRQGYLVPTADPDAVACAIEEAAKDPDADSIRARARAEVEARGRFVQTLDMLEARLEALAGKAAPDAAGTAGRANR